MIKSIPLVSYRSMAENDTICYSFLCIREVRFYENKEFKTCLETQILSYCQDFHLQFENGVVRQEHVLRFKTSVLM